MSAYPVIVSFYTVNTPYEGIVDGLRGCCHALGLEHHIVGIESRGSWEANNAAKAGICRDAWRELQKPILWVDADALIHKTPDLVRDTAADFGVHKWKGQYFAGGTLFFNQCMHTGRLLDDWVARCESDTSTLDQVHLGRVWQHFGDKPNFETLWLPRSYCQIFDAPRDEDPVIEHFQASRTHRAVA